jgi:aspartate racemase
MTGPVYARALEERGLGRLIPGDARRAAIQRAIFDELCQGKFLPETAAMFQDAIRDLAAAGADCAILGCTEIPLVVREEDSPLPTLDSTRLLARYAVREAVSGAPLGATAGWLAVRTP